MRTDLIDECFDNANAVAVASSAHQVAFNAEYISHDELYVLVFEFLYDGLDNVGAVGVCRQLHDVGAHAIENELLLHIRACEGNELLNHVRSLRVLAYLQELVLLKQT